VSSFSALFFLLAAHASLSCRSKGKDASKDAKDASKGKAAKKRDDQPQSSSRFCMFAQPTAALMLLTRFC
jgi:hypothetical protein